MREMHVNAKCRFWIDSDGWLNVWDGHESVAIAPDELDALRKFLVEAAGGEARQGGEG